MDLRNQEYFSAARAGDLDSIKRLVEGVAKPGVGIDGGPEKIDEGGLSSLLKLQNEAKQTGLYIAAENNYEEMFRYLLKRCDYQTAVLPSNLGITAFHVAAKKGNTGIVREFLSTWPEICKICDGTNTSPLYSAAVLNHLDIVNAILDVDPGSIRILRKNGKTALHTTARIGFLQMSKTLIKRDQGIVPIIDKKGQTALHMAVKGHEPAILDIIDEMLNVSPSILNGRDKKGNTPLHIATRKMRAQIVRLLLCYPTIELNAINNQKQTAMDLAEKSGYNEFSIDIKDSLREAGAKNAQNVGKANEASELRRTVSDIKHNVHTQLIQNAQTNKRVTGIAKELQKLHREAVQNTINSVTLVAVLIASIAFISIFDLPGQYIASFGEEIGKSNIADTLGFHLFFLLNATALFISLSVVVIQITLVAWETGAQKLVVSIMNKLMWAACVGTLGAFLSLAFVVVGKNSSWMAITITAIGVPMMVGTLGLMCCSNLTMLSSSAATAGDPLFRLPTTTTSTTTSRRHSSAIHCNLRELRGRIDSVKNTQKITEAMKLVAAAKVRRAQEAVVSGRPFSESLVEVLYNINENLQSDDVDVPLTRVRPVKKVGLVVVTGDRGLCGGFNNLIIKKAEQRIEELKGLGLEYTVISVGKKGNTYFQRRPYIPVDKFLDGGNLPTTKGAQSIADDVFSLFVSEEVDKVELLYTKFVSLIKSEPVIHTLLPLSPKGEICDLNGNCVDAAEDELFRLTTREGKLTVERDVVRNPMPDGFSPILQFEQDPVQILDALLPLYLNSQILRSLQESLASELAARMTAMSNATENANDLKTDLSRSYNRQRQAKITGEILEIVAGAEALG